jgi:hypothetical protein
MQCLFLFAGVMVFNNYELIYYCCGGYVWSFLLRGREADHSPPSSAEVKE